MITSCILSYTYNVAIKPYIDPLQLIDEAAFIRYELNPAEEYRWKRKASLAEGWKIFIRGRSFY
jgi:hypothetical protein